jgi:hypothetical protein
VGLRAGQFTYPRKVSAQAIQSITGVGGSKWYFGIFRFRLNAIDIRIVTPRATAQAAPMDKLPRAGRDFRLRLVTEYGPVRPRGSCVVSPMKSES